MVVFSAQKRRSFVMTAVVQHQSVETPITFTDAAKKHLTSYLEKRADVSGVRLSVKRSGCSGFSYVVDYVNTVDPTDKSEPLIGSYWLYIDLKSYPYLKGTQVDYVREGLNAHFTFQNPNQKGVCGCGESFTIND